MYKYTYFVKVVLLWIAAVCSIKFYNLMNHGSAVNRHVLHHNSQEQVQEINTVKSISAWNSSNSGQYRVPNIVHYVWYSDKKTEFRFDQALGVLSAVKYIKPLTIFLHTNSEPYGQYYDMVKELKIFQVVMREPPRHEVEPHFLTTYSDYDRVKILQTQGGIYLDFDVMVTQSFDKLRKYRCTIGYEKPERISGGIILCAKDEPFLQLWLQSYHEDHRPFWGYNSGGIPHQLAVKYPDLVHTEETRLNVPNCKQLEKIWGNQTYPWRENYAIHTWIRMLIKEGSDLPTPDSIKTMNSTFGDIARDVLYGSSVIKLP